MKIKHKLLLGAIGLALLPLALTSALLWQSATALSGQAIEQQVRTQLSALRDTKISQVRDEVDSRLAGLRALAANRLTAEALLRLKAGFEAVTREEPGTDGAAQQQALLAHMSREYAGEYNRRNPGPAPDLSPLVLGLSPQGLRLQVDYLARNPHPPGEKSRLLAAEGAASYHAAHAAYHPSLLRTQQLMGVQDLLLIDTATPSVTRVPKSSDLATL